MSKYETVFIKKQIGSEFTRDTWVNENEASEMDLKIVDSLICCAIESLDEFNIKYTKQHIGFQCDGANGRGNNNFATIRLRKTKPLVFAIQLNQLDSVEVMIQKARFETNGWNGWGYEVYIDREVISSVKNGLFSKVPGLG